jgi:broad specificity phosphatase PhoE
MRLLLARHGNTFAPGEPVVRAGLHNDLPLVESGRAQAAALGVWLRGQGIAPVKVYSGVLRRQLDYVRAALAAAELDVPVTVDERLNEIDYGDWTGLSNEEIIDRFGQEDFDRWEVRSQWPQTGNWAGSAEGVKHNLRAFAADAARGVVADEAVLVVSSNGILRYFLSLVPGAWEAAVGDGSFKMGTGHISQLSRREVGWRLDFWNREAAGISQGK